MIVKYLVFVVLTGAAVFGQQKLTPLLDRLEEDVRSDGYWRPL